MKGSWPEGQTEEECVIEVARLLLIVFLIALEHFYHIEKYNDTHEITLPYQYNSRAFLPTRNTNTKVKGILWNITL